MTTHHHTFRLIATLALGTLAVACKGRPEDAPAELDDLCAYLYSHHSDEDPAAEEAGVANLALWLDAHMDETAEGYTVHNLDQSTLDSLDSQDRDVTKIIGSAVGSSTELAVDDLVGPLITEDQALIYTSNFDSFERTFTTDPECFVDGTCDRVVFENVSVADLSIAGSLETKSQGQDLWVSTEHGMAIVHRSYMHEPAKNTFIQMEQQYNLAVTIPMASGGVARLQAVWADVEFVGMDVPESTALNMLIKGLTKQDEALYVYAGGDTASD